MVKIDKFEIVQIVQCKPVPLVYIVQCHSGGSGGFTRRELCRAYRNIGKPRKNPPVDSQRACKAFFIICGKRSTQHGRRQFGAGTIWSPNILQCACLQVLFPCTRKFYHFGNGLFFRFVNGYIIAKSFIIH